MMEESGQRATLAFLMPKSRIWFVLANWCSTSWTWHIPHLKWQKRKFDQTSVREPCRLCRCSSSTKSSVRMKCLIVLSMLQLQDLNYPPAHPSMDAMEWLQPRRTDLRKEKRKKLFRGAEEPGDGLWAGKAKGNGVALDPCSTGYRVLPGELRSQKLHTYLEEQEGPVEEKHFHFFTSTLLPVDGFL